MFSIGVGHHWQYLIDQVAKGAENYYTGEVEHGEVPGRWFGRGAELLGLSGLVDEADMEALYGHFVDPRDPHFRDRSEWVRLQDGRLLPPAEAARLGSPPRRYKSVDERFADRLAELQAAGAEPEEIEAQRWQFEKSTPSPVAFVDLTYSPPKSVTVLHTAFKAQEQVAIREGNEAAAAEFGRKAAAVEDAIWAGFHAGVEYAVDRAGLQRVGYHGTVAEYDEAGNEIGRKRVGRWIDAKDWVGAAFFQTTSRDNDPQLHIHGAVLNRTPGADGKWRTLDSRAIHRAKPGMSAVGDRTTFEQLTATLGTEAVMREDGKSRELAGITKAERELFSKRRTATVGKLAGLVAAFESEYGRSPNALELSNLSLQAAKASRRAKGVFEDASTRIQRWTAELRERLDGSFARIAEQATGRIDPRSSAAPFDINATIGKALNLAQSRKSAFTRDDLVRAIEDSLPDCLHGLSPAACRTVIDELADRALTDNSERVGTATEVQALIPEPLVAVPEHLRRADGSSQFTAGDENLYATAGHLAAESALEQAARQVDGRLMLDAQMVDAAIAQIQPPLSPDQAHAVRGITTSGRALETLLGPAGTGKSTTIGTLAHIWQDARNWPDGQAGRTVFGLGTAEDAAKILQGDGIRDTANIDRWVKAQQAITQGKRSETLDRWRLHNGDLIVIDEASMSTVDQMDAVRAFAAAHGAKVLHSGDYAQLSSVGAGGGMTLAAEAGRTYELDQVWRFAAGWEKEASLGVREGNVEALAAYEQRGRLHDGGTLEETQAAAARAWLASHLEGKRALLIVDTNEQAAQLSKDLRAQLQQLGQVGEPGATLGPVAGLAPVGAGDIIQARNNDWTYLRTQGRAVLNRELFRVTAVTEDGGLRVQPLDKDWNAAGQPITLAPSYAAEHVTLAYALTGHSAQGKDVDHGIGVARQGTSPNAFYTALTRGTGRNDMFLETVAELDDAQRMPDERRRQLMQDQRKTGRQVGAQILERREPELSATATARDAQRWRESLRRLGTEYRLAADLSYVERYGAILDQLAAGGDIKAGHRAQLHGDEGEVGQLWRLTRAAELAGHDPAQVLRSAITARELDTARNVATVLHERIEGRYENRLDPIGDSKLDRTAAGDPTSGYLRRLAIAIDARREQLGEQVAAQSPPPAWATGRLGPVPADEHDRADWTTRAGYLAAYREQYGHNDAHDAIGACPKPGQPEARADWYAAWRAMGAPEDTRELAKADDTELLAAISAHEREKAWAPAYAHEQQADAERLARTYQQEATLAAAQARTAGGQARAQAEQNAAGYTRLAGLYTRQAAQLEEVNHARGLWYAHTTETRQKADAARAELAARGRPYQGAQTGRDQAGGILTQATARQQDKARLGQAEQNPAQAAAQRRAQLDQQRQTIREQQEAAQQERARQREEHAQQPGEQSRPDAASRQQEAAQQGAEAARLVSKAFPTNAREALHARQAKEPDLAAAAEQVRQAASAAERIKAEQAQREAARQAAQRASDEFHQRQRREQQRSADRDRSR